jgi:uncharacterized integral membrane protein
MTTRSPAKTRNWSTPLIIGTFLFIAVSGVLLFFHLEEGLVKEAHEWIGIAFIFGALVHIKINWVQFKRYFSLGLPRAVMTSVLAGSLFFMLASGHEEGGNPMVAAVKTLEKAPLTMVAQLQSRDADELHMLLEAKGFKVVDNNTSLSTIASDSGKSERELIALLFGQPRHETL